METTKLKLIRHEHGIWVKVGNFTIGIIEEFEDVCELEMFNFETFDFTDNKFGNLEECITFLRNNLMGVE